MELTTTGRFLPTVSLLVLITMLTLGLYHAPVRPKIESALFTQVSYSINETEISDVVTVNNHLCKQSRRLKVLQRECHKLNRTFGDYQGQANIMVDDRHKLLFCLPRKSSSSSWSRLLIRASGKVPPGMELPDVHSLWILQKYGITRLKSYDQDGIVRRLENYYKFLVVRHPIERVVSAWYDKVIMPGAPFVGLGKKLAYRYKSNRTEHQINMKPGFWKDKPFFVEFARHLREDNHANEHWQSIDSFCSPCAVKWDAILKVESSLNDNDLVLTHLREDINVTNLPRDHNHHKDDEFNHFSKKMEDMRDIRPEVLRYLQKLYYNDFAMFGYHWDQENLMATCGIPNSYNTCC